MMTSKDQPGIILFGKRERFQYFDVRWPGKDHQPRFIERFIKPFYVSVIRLREGQELVGYYRMLIKTPEGVEEKYHILIHFQYAEDEQGTEEKGRPSFLAFAIVISDQLFPTAKYVSELYAGLKLQLSSFYRKPTYKLIHNIRLVDGFSLNGFNADRKLNGSVKTGSFFNAGAQLDKQISFLYSRNGIESIVGQFYEQAVKGEQFYEANHIYLSSTPLDQLRHTLTIENDCGEFEAGLSKRNSNFRDTSYSSRKEEDSADIPLNTDSDEILGLGTQTAKPEHKDTQAKSDSTSSTQDDDVKSETKPEENTSKTQGWRVSNPSSRITKNSVKGENKRKNSGTSRKTTGKKSSGSSRRGRVRKSSGSERARWPSKSIKRLLGSVIILGFMGGGFYLVKPNIIGELSEIFGKKDVEHIKDADKEIGKKKSSGEGNKGKEHEPNKNNVEPNIQTGDKPDGIKDYEGLNLEQLVERFDSNVNLINARKDLKAVPKLELIQKHGRAVESHYRVLLFSLKTKSFTRIMEQFESAMEVSRAIESRGEMTLSLEVVNLLGDLRRLKKLGDRLENNLLKAQTYAYQRVDSYSRDSLKYFVKPLRGETLNGLQMEYVTELKAEFLAIHKECENWWINEREAWIEWLRDALIESNRVKVKNKITASQKNQTYKSKFLEMLRRDIYCIVLSPKNRKLYISSNNITSKMKMELQDHYLNQWGEFLEQYLKWLNDLDNEGVEGLFNDKILLGKVQYYGILKNEGFEKKIFNDFENSLEEKEND